MLPRLGRLGVGAVGAEEAVRRGAGPDPAGILDCVMSTVYLDHAATTPMHPRPSRR